MAKMNVATFLIGNIAHKVPNEISDSERGIIISQLIDSWEDRKYLHPLPKFQSRRSVNHFSPEYNWGFRKD